MAKILDNNHHMMYILKDYHYHIVWEYDIIGTRINLPLEVQP